MSSLEERAERVAQGSPLVAAVRPTAVPGFDIQGALARMQARTEEVAARRQEAEARRAPWREELDRRMVAGEWDRICPERPTQCPAKTTIVIDGVGEELDCPAWEDNTCPFWEERRAAWGAEDLAEIGFRREFLFPHWGRVPADQRKALRLYCDTIETRMQQGEGMVLGGRPGSGKTSMLALVALAAIRPLYDNARLRTYPGERPSLYFGEQVCYVKSALLFDDLFRDKQDHHLPSARLMLIDDLGTEWRSEGSWVRFNTLIDARWERRQATVITTNIGLKQLTEDPAMERMISRLSQRNPWLWSEGTDQRTPVSVAAWAEEWKAERAGEQDGPRQDY